MARALCEYWERNWEFGLNLKDPHELPSFSLLNCPPLLSHLQRVSVSLSPHVCLHTCIYEHVHTHTCKGIFFLTLHHRPTSILPRRRKMAQERGNIFLRDLIMLVSVNSYSICTAPNILQCFWILLHIIMPSRTSWNRQKGNY